MFNKIITSLMGQLFITLLGLAIISACTMRPNSALPHHNGLANTQWILKKLPDHEGVAEPLPALNFTENKLKGFNGCNRIFATYAIGNSGSIAIGATGSTRMACINAAGEVERKLDIALQNTRLFALSRSELNLMDDKRKVLAVFTPKTAK